MIRTKVEDHPQYEKDSQSKAVINVDKNGLNAYKTQREKFMKVFNAHSEIEDLKRDVQDIKNLLHQLINNKTNV